jgi:phage terminase small subunit
MKRQRGLKRPERPVRTWDGLEVPFGASLSGTRGEQNEGQGVAVRKQTKKSDKPKRSKALTLRRAAFVAEFIRTFNARRSAIAAGYSERGAQAQGSYLLTNPKVIADIEAARAKLIEKIQVTSERMLSELAGIAFFDPADVFNPDGTLMALSEMPPQARRAIAGIEVETLFSGTGDNRQQIGLLRKIRLVPKLQALEMLARHLGLFIERHEITGPNRGPVEVDAQINAVVFSDPEVIVAVQNAYQRYKLRRETTVD